MSGPDDLTTTPADDGTPVIDLHEPIYREMAEPRDGYEPMPPWLVFLCMAIMGFGGWYLGMFSGGFFVFCCGAFGLLIPGGIVFYLLRPHVRAAFGQ